MSRFRPQALAEAVGTFFLVFIGTGTVAADIASGGAVGPVGIALSFGGVIAAMIYAVGHISGAHFNPAVTIGLWSVGRFPTAALPIYVGAQCLGAVAGAGAVAFVFAGGAAAGVTAPAIPLPQAALVETLLSFALLFVIIAVATDGRVAGAASGLAVGLVVAFGSLMGGGLTGASMNPARSLGPAIVAGRWDAHWLFWVAPIVGMLVAARVYQWVRSASRPDGDAARAAH